MPDDMPDALSFAAYEVGADGNVRQLSDFSAACAPAEAEYQWIRIVLHRNTGTHEALEDLNLPPIVTQALLAHETQPRFSKLAGGALLVLRGVNTQSHADPDDMVSVRIWMEPKRIITVQLRQVRSVQEISEAFEHGSAPKTIGSFLTDLVCDMSSKIESMVANLVDQLHDLEEGSLDNGGATERMFLSELRRQLIVVRRYVAPQRSALERISLSDISVLKDTDRQLTREACDQTVRLVDELDAARERATVISETWAANRAEEMNRNMLLLSIIAAVFLPLGFMTGLLGINVGGVPGADFPYAFWIVCVLSGGLAAGLYALFKWLKWI